MYFVDDVNEWYHGIMAMFACLLRERFDVTNQCKCGKRNASGKERDSTMVV